jgi:hypothetical protein
MESMWNKVMEFTLIFKTMMGLFFSAGIIIYVVFGFMVGEREISFELVVQIFFLSILVTVFQYVFWSEDSKIRWQAGTKLFVQYLLLSFVLFGMSQLFNWFRVGSETFYNMLIMYHVIYICAIFGFSVYFKVLGMRFNQKMLHYREQRQVK